MSGSANGGSSTFDLSPTTAHVLCLDVGATVAALEYATSRTAVLIGKFRPEQLEDSSVPPRQNPQFSGRSFRVAGLLSGSLQSSSFSIFVRGRQKRLTWKEYTLPKDAARHV